MIYCQFLLSTQTIKRIITLFLFYILSESKFRIDVLHPVSFDRNITYYQNGKLDTFFVQFDNGTFMQYNSKVQQLRRFTINNSLNQPMILGIVSLSYNKDYLFGSIDDYPILFNLNTQQSYNFSATMPYDPLVFLYFQQLSGKNTFIQITSLYMRLKNQNLTIGAQNILFQLNIIVLTNDTSSIFSKCKKYFDSPNNLIILCSATNNNIIKFSLNYSNLTGFAYSKSEIFTFITGDIVNFFYANNFMFYQDNSMNIYAKDTLNINDAITIQTVLTQTYLLDVQYYGNLYYILKNYQYVALRYDNLNKIFRYSQDAQQYFINELFDYNFNYQYNSYSTNITFGYQKNSANLYRFYKCISFNQSYCIHGTNGNQITNNTSQQNQSNTNTTNTTNNTIQPNDQNNQIGNFQSRNSGTLNNAYQKMGTQILILGSITSKINYFNNFRAFLPFLLPLFIFFDDYWYYIYHHNNYQNLKIIPLFLNYIYQSDKQKIFPQFMSNEQIVKKVLNAQNQLIIFHSYTDKVVLAIDEQQTYFFKNLQDFFMQIFTSSLLFLSIIIMVFFIQRFKNVKFDQKGIKNQQKSQNKQNKNLSIYQKKTILLKIFLKIYRYLKNQFRLKKYWITIFEGNLIFLSFRAGLQFKRFFYFNIQSKFNIILLLFFFLFSIIFGMTFYFIYEQKSIFLKQNNKNKKKKIQINCQHKQQFHNFLFLGFKSLSLGFIHSYFLDSNALQISLLIFIKFIILFFIIKYPIIFQSRIIRILTFIYYLSQFFIDFVILLRNEINYLLKNLQLALTTQILEIILLSIVILTLILIILNEMLQPFISKCCVNKKINPADSQTFKNINNTILKITQQFDRDIIETISKHQKIGLLKKSRIKFVNFLNQQISIDQQTIKKTKTLKLKLSTKILKRIVQNNSNSKRQKIDEKQKGTMLVQTMSINSNQKIESSMYIKHHIVKSKKYVNNENKTYKSIIQRSQKTKNNFNI